MVLADFVPVLEVVPAVVGDVTSSVLLLVSTVFSVGALLVWEVVGASVLKTIIVCDSVDAAVLV